MYKTTLAHRFAYETFTGMIPPGMCVLHKCDIPRCVNPAHLFLGSQANNNHDCITKGRFRSVRRHVQHMPSV